MRDAGNYTITTQAWAAMACTLGKSLAMCPVFLQNRQRLLSRQCCCSLGISFPSFPSFPVKLGAGLGSSGALVLGWASKFQMALASPFGSALLDGWFFLFLFLFYFIILFHSPLGKTLCWTLHLGFNFLGALPPPHL